MDEETRKALEVLDGKLNDIYRSVERTRKYFLWTMIGSILVFVLPLIGLLFVLPSAMSSLTGDYGSLYNNLNL